MHLPLQNISKNLHTTHSVADLKYGYKITGGNAGIAGKKRTIPHYMTMFL